MKRCTPILILCVALTAACSTPRKACRQADRLIARAALKCPGVLRPGSIAHVLPGDTVVIPMAYADSIRYDSLLAACAALGRALRSEAAGLPRPAVPVGRQAVRPTTQLQAATAAVRAAACEFAPVHERSGNILVTVTSSPAGPVITIEELARTIQVPCPPVVQQVVRQGVAAWYRAYFWGTIILTILTLVLGTMRHRR